MRKRTALHLIFAYFLLSSSVIAQTTTTIYCDPSADQKPTIPAWTGPGEPYALQQLTCGQKITVIGFDRGFYRVQIGDRVGYVDAKYVRIPGAEPKPAITPSPQAKTPAPTPKLEPVPEPKRDHPASTPSKVHEPKGELFLGYTYVNFDTNNVLRSRQNADGWEIAVSGNFGPHFAVEFDGSGYYKRYSSPGFGKIFYQDYAYLSGPRFNLGPGFIHAMFGVDHLIANSDYFSSSQAALAAAMGSAYPAIML